MKTNIETRMSIPTGRTGVIAALAAVVISLLLTTGAFAVIDPGSSATGQNTTAGSTELTINKPATTEIGDVLLAQITFHTGVTATLVPPTGWIEAIRTDNGNELGQILYTKVAGPSEPDSYTWTFTSGTTRASGGIANYSGVDQTTPVGETSGNSGNSTVLTALSVEAEDDSRLVLNLGIKESTTITTPAGFTFRFLQRLPTGGNLTVRAEDRARNAGPTGDSVSESLDSDFWIAQHIILLTDVTPPSVVMTTSATDPTNQSPIPVFVQFSEGVNGFEEEDIVVTNGTVGNFTFVVTGTYSFEVTPSAVGEVTIDLPAGVAQDPNGNANTAAASLVLNFNSESPTVSITSSASNPTSVSPIPVTIQFSKVVTGFEASDIGVTNGTIGNFAVVDGDTYTLEVTPTAFGTVTLTIAAGVATDELGSPNLAASPFVREFVELDTTPPTVTLSSTSDDPTSESPIPVTVQFSEIVSGFVVSDIVITNGTASSFTTIDGDTYAFNLTPGAPGVVTVNVPAGVATDEAGNPNTAAAPLTRTFEQPDPGPDPDTTPPSVTVNQAPGQADPTTTSPVNFLVTFSEPVTGFDSDSVTIGGTAGATTAVVSQIAPNDGTTYNVAVSGMTNSGTVILSIPAGVVADASGNENLASTSTDNTVTFNVEGPDEDDLKSYLPFIAGEGE